MAQFLRALSNRYSDFRLIRLDPRDGNSPLVVVQEGYDPSDPAARVWLFFLTRNEDWLDEIAASKLSDSDLAQVIFDSAAEAMAAIEALSETPKVRDAEISRADIETYIRKVEGVSADQIGKRMLERYRAGKAKG